MRRKRAFTPRRKSFLKSTLRRAIDTAKERNLNVTRIDVLSDGTASLVIAKTPIGDSAANENPWDEVLTPQPN
jgi:hypothetical protein